MNQNLISLSEYKESLSVGIGRKASHLAKLLSAGFPVPQGYVAPVAVYENFISLNGLKDKIAKCLETTVYNEEGGPASLKILLKDKDCNQYSV
jgi:phosphoenolpyruvate synthase/pyruvate phosphate dikinase